jgi:integrase
MSCNFDTLTGPFKDVIPKYVVFKRSIGYDFDGSITYRLKEIDRFFESHGVTDVAIPEAVACLWAKPRDGEAFNYRCKRVSALNVFARYLKTLGHDDIYEIDLPRGSQKSRFIPHIFTRDEIDRLFDALDARWAANHDRDTATFVMMFLLYYGCGLRKSEVQRMRMCDIDLDTGKISIIDSKNHVSRNVFLADSALRQMRFFCERYCMGYANDAFVFQGEKVDHYCDSRLYANYHRLLDDANIARRDGGRYQRLHDLRHTFCVRTLESMVAKGFDLYTSFALLVTYLGHKSITETEYYLRLVEEDFTTVTRLSAAYAPTLFPKVGDEDEVQR